MNRSRSSLPAAVLYGGSIAGAVDVGAAALMNKISPIVILRALASGLPGMAAFSGGRSTAWLGLLLQSAMSWPIAGVFARGVGSASRPAVKAVPAVTA